MILRPYKLYIGKIHRLQYTSECLSMCGSGSEHLDEARTAHSMDVDPNNFTTSTVKRGDFERRDDFEHFEMAGLEFQRESESPLSQRLPQMNPRESS